MGEEFLLDIIALLNQQLSKKKIKEQLKGMDNSMFVKVISKLSIGLSKRQLKKDLKQLNDLYLQVGADLKIDSALKKKLQGRIKTLQDSISDLQIGVRAKDSDITKSVTEARNKGQRVASRTSIDFNIEVKKEKAIADLEYMAKKYSRLFSNASASSKYNNILDAAYGITDAKQLSNVRAQIAAFTSELKANNLASQSLGDKWKRLIDRAKDLFSAASAVTLIFSQVKQAVSSFLQLDTAMTNLYKVQDQITSRDQFSGLLSKWNKLAQNLAVTTNSLISSMEAWSKIGFNLDMSEQLAEITSIFEKTAEISNEKATSTLISAAQAFTEIDDLGVDDYVKRVEAVGNKINAIGNKYSIDSEGIADGLQNTSAALKVAGNDLNETIALITATNKIYQNPDEGSNMLKVASMRLRGQVDALKEMEEDAEGVSTDLTKIQQQIYELTGNKVNIFEDDENLKSTYQMILEIGEVFDSLNDRSQADLLEVMFGKQRASAGASLLLNYEELEKIKNDSINSANSMAEEYSKYMESAGASLTIFKEKLVETYSTFMSGDLIKYTADMGSGLLDLVNATDLLRHGLVGIISLNIGKGITSIGASIASTVKQMNTLGNALQQVKNLPVDDGLRKKALQEIGKETKNLTENNLKLLLSQKKLEDNDKITILTKHKLSEEEAKLKLEKMGLLSVTKTQTAANVAEAATTGTLKNAMLSLKATAKEVGVTIKGIFASNPIGMGLMLVTTIFSVATTAISKHNEKLEETRRANIESATAASENADKLKDLYNEYTRLASIQDRTTSEEEAFKTAVENITVALGDKAEILKDLTAGTDEYADALKEATKAELENQYVSAKVGAKAAEDALKDVAYSSWDGSHITIQQNEQMAGVEEHMAALEAVKDILSEYEDISQNGVEWEPINWDSDHDDMNAVVEYYNALIEARNKLVTADNADFLMSSDIYEDINTTINDLSESVETYTKQQYNALKLNYEWQNGIPGTKAEFEAMENSILSASGAGKAFQDILKGYLTEDFSSLATDIGSVNDAVGDASAQAKSAIPLFNQLTSSEEELDKFQASVKSATEAYSTLLSGNYTSTELLDSIQAINQAVSDMDGSLNWEFINSQADSLDVLGDAIQCVSTKYANSILSGAGININSDFRKMLADMIQQAYEAEAEFAGMNTQLDNLQSSYQTLTSIIESYNETGYISLDSLQSLLTADENLIAMLEVENGQLAINQAAYENLVAVQLMELKAKLINAAAAEIEELAKQKAEEATNNNASASNNAVEKLDAETAAINRNTSAAISNAVAKAEEAGVSEEEIQGVLDKNNEVWNALLNNFSGDFSGFMGGGSKAAKSAGKEAADAYLESFEKELKDLDDLKDRGKITEKQYLDALRRLYLKYFNQKKKYLKEFEKYEHQYLDGMKSLYESAFSYITKQIDKRIDAINDEKDAAVSALEAERDARLEAIEAQKEQYENEIEGIEKQIDAKEKEIKAMQDANAERKRAIDLQGKEYNLQRMQNQKTANVYKGGQMGYEADTSGVRDAKQEVEDAKLEIDVSKIEKEIDLLEDEKGILQERIELLEKEAEQVNKYYDNLIKQTELHYDSMIKGLEDYKAQFEGLTDLLENAQLESALAELGINMDALLNGSQEEFEKLKTAYIGILADMSRGNDGVLDQLSRLSGISTQSISYLDATKGAFEGLGDVALEGLESSVDGIGESVNALSTSAGEASTAVGKIQESVSSTSQSITPLNEELGNLKTLISGLTELLNNIKFPEIGDEGYAQKLRDIAQAFGEIASKCNEFKTIDFSSIIGSASVPSTDGAAMPGVDGMEGSAGTGFMGLASAISEAVASIDEQMGKLETALGKGNSHFKNQMSVINDEYLPAWESLQARLAEIIGVGGGNGDNKEGKGNQGEGGKEGGSGTGVDSGSIIGIMQTGGEEVAARLEDPWLKAFNDFATDGDNSIQTVCDKIIELVSEMARVIQEKCDAAASALNALAETASSSLSSVGGSVSWNTVAHAEGTVGDAFANGTGYNGLPHDEKDALRSEYGQQELAVYPNGKTELTTEPTMSDLPKGTVIFNEEQTRRIMDNEGKELGNAYDDGTITLADGTEIRPLNPSDREYWLHKKFDEFFKKNKDAFLMPTNAMFKTAESVDKMVEVINNNHTMRQNVVNIGDIHLHEVQDVDRFSDELILRFPNKVLQKMHRV